PSSWSWMYASCSVGVIHVPSSRSAQARITRSNAASMVAENFPLRSFRANRRDTWSPSISKMARGSGENQRYSSAGWGHGNAPARYAATIVSGSKLAPMPTSPCSSASRASGNTNRLGGSGQGAVRVATRIGIGGSSLLIARRTARRDHERYAAPRHHPLPVVEHIHRGEHRGSPRLHNAGCRHGFAARCRPEIRHVEVAGRVRPGGDLLLRSQRTHGEPGGRIDKPRDDPAVHHIVVVEVVVAKANAALGRTFA